MAALHLRHRLPAPRLRARKTRSTLAEIIPASYCFMRSFQSVNLFSGCHPPIPLTFGSITNPTLIYHILPQCNAHHLTPITTHTTNPLHPLIALQAPHTVVYVTIYAFFPPRSLFYYVYIQSTHVANLCGPLGMGIGYGAEGIGYSFGVLLFQLFFFLMLRSCWLVG